MPSSESKKTRKTEKKDRTANVARGRMFEKLAAKYLVEIGFEILEKNWQAGHKEIDLIAKKHKLVVFVEVKSASNRKFGHPAERVDQKKINNLTLAAEQYLLVNDLTGHDLRFDLITFLEGKIEHYPNAFEASR